jgi:hypothetical protein
MTVQIWVVLSVRECSCDNAAVGSASSTYVSVNVIMPVRPVLKGNQYRCEDAGTSSANST